MPSSRAMDETEAADRLGLSVTTLRAWRHRRTGPTFVRFGRAVRYLVEDLDKFIDDCRIDTQVPSSATVVADGPSGATPA